jgi:hypothetical protein
MNEKKDGNTLITGIRQRRVAPVQGDEVETNGLNSENMILPVENQSPETRFKVFKGRHIQMMALGSSTP